MDRRMLTWNSTQLYSTVLKLVGERKCVRIDTLMCQRTTSGARMTRIAAILLLTALTAAAQTPADSLRPNWRRIGSSAMELALASPATGPVGRIWFSPDGSRL